MRAQRSPEVDPRGPAADVVNDIPPEYPTATFHPRLSGYIDRAVAQLEACPDDACRRAWRAVLDGLEEMQPAGVGEPDR